MKKLVWGLAACVLLISALSLQAGEKRYRIQLAANDDVFGKPVTFQEILPMPAPVPAPRIAPPSPTPVYPEHLAPVPDPYSGVPVPSVDGFQTVGLYHRVKYEDLDHIHPQAVKKIVAVKDPCAKDTLCGTCEPPCVYVMICVPPCDKFEYDVKRKDHSKVEYDYGDYEIEITSKNGVVSVDYDD